MKIEKVDVFQVRWSPEDKPQQNSAWVRIHCEDGISGIGEASPMLGGLASLGIIARDIAPGLVGKDRSTMRCCSRRCCIVSSSLAPKAR
jgi:L-alanine-DL-glutamate epimerase-like enolase superfamily enzyme